MRGIERFLQDKKPLIDSVILHFIPRKLTQQLLHKITGKPRYSFDLKAAEKALHKPIWELLSRGGKRWRPALFLLIAEAFGADPKKLLELSIIPEVIHNGTLMVDDVEDNSDLRRGKPAIHRIYGTDIAINASSGMYYLPLLALIKNKRKFPVATVNAAYELYVREMINLSYGQAFDILWHKGKSASISEGDYLQMCAFKTGTLARMAAKLGALFAGASKKNIELAGEFAESIGIAFQIQDDILNLTGSQEYGKEIGGDISEGKRTLIILRALKKAKKGDAEKLLHLLNSHTKDQVFIGQAISIIRGTDALEYSRERAKQIVKSAWEKFSKVLKQSEAKQQLKEFAEYLIERKA